MVELLVVFFIGYFVGVSVVIFLHSKMFRDWRVRRQQRKWNKSKDWFRG